MAAGSFKRNNCIAHRIWVKNILGREIEKAKQKAEIENEKKKDRIFGQEFFHTISIVAWESVLFIPLFLRQRGAGIRQDLTSVEMQRP